MPDTILAVVFETQSDASKGASALKDLNGQGDLTLYDHALLTKDEAGQVTVVQASDEGPLGAATGLLFGGLVGMLAGPVGMALGMRPKRNTRSGWPRSKRILRCARRNSARRLIWRRTR